jgi:hypothetical protein
MFVDRYFTSAGRFDENIARVKSYLRAPSLIGKWAAGLTVVLVVLVVLAGAWRVLHNMRQARVPWGLRDHVSTCQWPNHSA